MPLNRSIHGKVGFNELEKFCRFSIDQVTAVIVVASLLELMILRMQTMVKEEEVQ